MITTQLSPAYLLTFDAEEYAEHIRIINKVVCSYSRFEAFTEAIDQLSATTKYTVVADKWCLHNNVYIFDEEGFMTAYIFDEAKEL